MERRNRGLGVRDNIYWGAFLGLIFPVIGFLLFYIFAFSDEIKLSQYWEKLFSDSQISAALSLAVITNLPVFFLNLWNHRYTTVKGILGATIFYGVFIILFKFS